MYISIISFIYYFKIREITLYTQFIICIYIYVYYSNSIVKLHNIYMYIYTYIYIYIIISINFNQYILLLLLLFYLINPKITKLTSYEKNSNCSQSEMATKTTNQ